MTRPAETRFALTPDLLARLAARAEDADRRPDWPAASGDVLRSAGGPGWAVPREYGGAGLGPAELLQAGEGLASACLTTAFALSQQEAAVRRLLAGPEHLKRRFLPRVAAGESFVTV